MTVLVLDERWPTLIPLEAFGRIENPVTYTSEVPISVRWHLDDIVTGDDITGRGILVTTNPEDPEVIARLKRGESVIEVDSRQDPTRVAVQTMAKAVRVGEWEARQTHESLLPFLAEESQEFADAVREGAPDEELRRELGDILLQILFHSEIASRRGAFKYDDVAQAFVDKMKSRAPYLFDGTLSVVDEDTQNELWAAGKKAEKDTGA